MPSSWGRAVVCVDSSYVLSRSKKVDAEAIIENYKQQGQRLELGRLLLRDWWHAKVIAPKRRRNKLCFFITLQNTQIHHMDQVRLFTSYNTLFFLLSPKVTSNPWAYECPTVTQTPRPQSTNLEHFFAPCRHPGSSRADRPGATKSPPPQYQETSLKVQKRRNREGANAVPLFINKIHRLMFLRADICSLYL